MRCITFTVGVILFSSFAIQLGYTFGHGHSGAHLRRVDGIHISSCFTSWVSECFTFFLREADHKNRVYGQFSSRWSSTASSLLYECVFFV